MNSFKPPETSSPAPTSVGSVASALPWKRSCYGLALVYFLSLVGFYSILRLVLFVSFPPKPPAPWTEVFETFLIGLYRDGYVALVLSTPLLGWFWMVRQRSFGRRWHRVLLTGGLFLFWMVQPFLLAAEFYFFDEFKSRFNTVAVDYLLYPSEVFLNIWDAYPVPTVVGLCAAFSLGWIIAAYKYCSGLWQPSYAAKSRLIPFAAAVALCVVLAPTVKLKGLHFSRERLLNELADNGAISFLSAAVTHNLDYVAFYKTMPRDEAYPRVRRLLTEPNTEFQGAADSLLRHVAGDPNRPRLNVVLFLEESLGSEFWGSLGRPEPTLTPEMDRLANEAGLLFTNLYASGNRTVRGFEGVLSSFPPLPGEAIVKRDRSDNVETLARILKRDGYTSVFLYGGRGLFDGMRTFTMNNGYDRFIEQKHFAHPTFSTIWGVCDEDIFNRALEECRALANTGQPFHATVLSVSNHKPYTYPKGRIPENPDERRRENAVKYSDYCLGQFFQAAKKEPFWTNTIFAVVADHGARVYGSQSIPIHSYEIPLLITGPSVVKTPGRVPQLGCSLDVAPTILGLLGRPYDTLFFGRDLLQSPPASGRVWLNHNRDIGLFMHDRLVVLGLKQRVEYYQGDPKRAEIQPLAKPTALELELEKDAIAIFQVADDLYIHRRYHLD